MDPTDPLAPTAQDLQVRTRRTDNTLWIELCGEIDLASHPRLTKTLSSVTLDEVDTLGLDLGALTFCDARGLCYLLDVAQRARSAGHEVVARAATGTIRKMTRILGYEVLVRFE
ncbi:MAG TPA: STAS domain-containing protein [Nocardioidaceae bacterium]|nr:STAS domain-containing protein [Nocardioidaceae bacterium]